MSVSKSARSSAIGALRSAVAASTARARSPRSAARGMVFVELRPDEAREVLAIHDLRGDAIGQLDIGVEGPQHLIVVALPPKGHPLPSAPV